MKSLPLLLTICICHFGLAQKNDITSLQSLPVQVEDLALPIHKVTQFQGTLWAVDYGAGNVFRSTDDGASFSKLATLGSEYFEVIQFVNKKTGFICGDYGYVYKTTDGGDSWTDISPSIEGRITERYRNDTTKNQKPDGAFSAYYSMHFLNSKEGFVSGFKFNPSKGFRDSYRTLFFHTEDGGVSWTELEGKAQKETIKEFEDKARKQNNTFENRYYFNKQSSWKTAKNRAGENIIVHVNRKTSQSDTVLLPKTSYKRIMLRNITFLNEKTGFIFGGALDEGQQNAVIYHTTDGGSSWSLLPNDWSHIHAAISTKKHLLIFGKEGLRKRINVEEITK